MSPKNDLGFTAFNTRVHKDIVKDGRGKKLDLTKYSNL